MAFVPMETLGGAPGIGPREIRNSYVRLIRKYRPEQFPEQYRRIREAYEQLRGTPGKTQSSRSSVPSANLPDGSSNQQPVQKRRQPHAVDPTVIRSGTNGGARSSDEPPHDRQESSEVKSELPHGYDKKTAYRELRKIAITRPVFSHVFTYLYWLLRSDPSLDSECEPLDWIERGLDSMGFQETLAELFKREIANGADPGLKSRWMRRAMSMDARLSALLLQSWCDARVRAHQWEPMFSGLKSIREEILNRDSEQWFRLMLFVVDRVAWEDDAIAKQVYRACWNEMEGMSECHLSFAESLLYYDEYASLVVRMRQVEAKGGRLIKLACAAVRAGWRLRAVRNIEKPLPKPVENFVMEVLEDPTRALRQFDKIAHLETANRQLEGGHGRSGAVLLRYLNNLFSGSEVTPGMPNMESQSGIIIEFLDDMGGQKYERLREPMLEFCQREVVSMSELLHVLRANPRYEVGRGDLRLSESLQSDESFRLVLAIHERMSARKF